MFSFHNPESSRPVDPLRKADLAPIDEEDDVFGGIHNVVRRAATQAFLDFDTIMKLHEKRNFVNECE